MAVEPYTLAAYAVSVGSVITSSAAVAAAKWALETRQDSAQALRILRGEEDVNGDGLLSDVAETEELAEGNREALLHAGLFPPVPEGRIRGDDDE